MPVRRTEYVCCRYSRRVAIVCLILCSPLLIADRATSAEPPPQTWNLWPGKAPGEIKELPPEYDTTKPDDKQIAGRRVIRLHNVSVPTITVYKPDPAPAKPYQDARFSRYAWISSRPYVVFIAL